MLPAFIVRRPLVGTVVSSMPFLDGGGPCACSDGLDDAASWHAAVGRGAPRGAGVGRDALRAAADRRRRADRSTRSTWPWPLPADPGTLWRAAGRQRPQPGPEGGAGRAVRRVRRGARSSTSSTGSSPRACGSWARRCTRGVSSPPSSMPLATGRGSALVRKGETPIGGLVALAFRDSLTVPWASCASAYSPLCPNMLLYWETIRAACADGFRAVRLRPLDPRFGHLSVQAAVGRRGGAALLVHDSDPAARSRRAHGIGTHGAARRVLAASAAGR